MSTAESEIMADEYLVPAAEFSVREYAKTARGSHRDELDLTKYLDRPLAWDVLEMVDYLSLLERGALQYLRSVLVTPTHKDGRVAAFLVNWAYEKFWIADALEQIVLAHPKHPDASKTRPGFFARVRFSIAERTEPIRESVVANLIGEDIIAVHMFTGAVDDWILESAYDRLIDSCGHDELVKDLTSLREVKRRHTEFFTAQMRDRLAASPKAAPLARRRLKKIAWPLGAEECSPALAARLSRDLLHPEDITAIDARIAEFADADLQLVARAARSER
ncbi:MAG: hypothetical protein QM607_08605 [Microbacterium sp.]